MSLQAMSMSTSQSDGALLNSEVNVSKLGQSLSMGISSGDKVAAETALSLLLEMKAKLDINISDENTLMRKQEDEFRVTVHVEDREAVCGIISVKVKSSDTIRDLKERFCQNHGFPIEVQHWIIGKRIHQDSHSLSDLGIKQNNKLYLYIASAHSVGLTREAFEAHRASVLMSEQQNYYSMLMKNQMVSPQVLSDPYSFGFSTMSSIAPGNQSPLNLIALQGENKWNSPFMNTTPLMTESKLTQEPTSIVSPLISAVVSSSPSPSSIGASSNSLGSQDSGLAVSEYAGKVTQSLLLNSAPPQAPQSQAQSMPLQKQTEIAGWNCPTCTYFNLPTRPGCEMCSEDRPSSYLIPPGYEMTPEEVMRRKADEEMERKTREPELTAEQMEEHELVMRLSRQMMGEPKPARAEVLDQHRFQIPPTTILHGQTPQNPPRIGITVADDGTDWSLEESGSVGNLDESSEESSNI